jgi:hypothetical protein
MHNDPGCILGPMAWASLSHAVEVGRNFCGQQRTQYNQLQRTPAYLFTLVRPDTAEHDILHGSRRDYQEKVSLQTLDTAVKVLSCAQA